MSHRIYAFSVYNRAGDKTAEYVRVYTPRMAACVMTAYARRGISCTVDYNGPRTSYAQVYRHEPWTWQTHAYGRPARYAELGEVAFLNEAEQALAQNAH